MTDDVSIKIYHKTPTISQGYEGWENWTEFEFKLDYNLDYGSITEKWYLLHKNHLQYINIEGVPFGCKSPVIRVDKDIARKVWQYLYKIGWRTTLQQGNVIYEVAQ